MYVVADSGAAVEHAAAGLSLKPPIRAACDADVG